jgi:hypothetical protein
MTTNNTSNNNDTMCDIGTSDNFKPPSRGTNIDFDEIDDDLLQRKALLRLEHRRI